MRALSSITKAVRDVVKHIWVQPANARRAWVEQLEDRQLLSVSVPPDFSLITTFTVAATNSSKTGPEMVTPNLTLEQGTEYLFVASGTVKYGFYSTKKQIDHQADADFQFNNYLNNATGMKTLSNIADSSGSYVDIGLKFSNLTMRGIATSDNATIPDDDPDRVGATWGEYQDDHVYGVYATAVSESGGSVRSPQFWFQDVPGWYNDDARSFTVKVYKRPPVVDLDVDSDNNDGWGSPSRSGAEDAVEDVANDPSRPGKLLWANSSDSDGDGVPDFADGINLYENEGANASDHFLPIVLELPKYADLSKATLKFTYEASDPAGIQRVGDPDAGYTYTPAAGKLRLWTKDGVASRSIYAVNASGPGAVQGDFIPTDVALSPDNLPADCLIGTNTWRLYVEGLGTSAAPGDLQISVALSYSNGTNAATLSDSVRMIGVDWSFAEPDGAGGIRTTMEIGASESSPVITLSTYALNNIRATDDYSGIVGDLQLAGTVDDAVADIYAGSDRVINSVYVYLNEGQEPYAVITPTCSKAQGDGGVWKPYDFLGAFSETLAAVPLREGINVVRLIALDKWYGTAGYVEFSFEANAQSPAPIVTQSPFDLELGFASPPSSGQTDTISAKIRIGTTSWIQDTLVETGANTGIYQNADASFAVAIDPTWTPSADLWDHLELLVANNQLGISNAQVKVVESGSTTLVFDTYPQVTEEDDLEDYRRFSFSINNVAIIGRSDGGELNPYMIQLQGPADLFAAGDMAFNTMAGEYTVCQGPDGKYYMSTVKATAGAVAAAASTPAPATQPAIVLKLKRANDIYQKMQVDPKDAPDFAKGFVVGFGKGAVSIVTDTWELAKTAYNIDQEVRAIGIGLVLGDSATYNKLKGYKDKATRVAQKLNQIQKAVNDEINTVIEGVITGDPEVLETLSEDAKFVADVTSDIVLGMLESVANMTPYEKGEIYGRVAWEVASFVALEIITSESGGWGGLQKLATLGNMLKRFSALDKSAVWVAKALAAFEKLGIIIKEGEIAFEAGSYMEKVSKLSATMCFVAGTKVLTADGSKPIELIKPGDMVLSRDPATGAQGYKEVVETFVTHPNALWHVSYSVAIGETAQTEELVATGTHPFYVVNRGTFVPAEDLKLGDLLRLANGATATVTGEWVEHVTPGNSFTTYNFEVRDYHTYFVGDEGVWVHNAGRPCEVLAKVYTRSTRILGESDAQAFARMERLIHQRVAKQGLSAETKYKELGDALEIIVKERRAAAGKPLDPTKRIWMKGKPGDAGINLWDGHWIKHQPDFPNMSSPIEYVEQALDFVEHPPTTTKIGIRPNLQGTVDSTGKVIREKVFLDTANGHFAVQILDGPEAGALKTYFPKNGTLTDWLNYWAKQGITQTIQ